MADDLPEILLGSVDESRRIFIRKLIVNTAFVLPGVASFAMGGLGIGEASANVSNLTCIASNLGGAPTSVETIGYLVGNYNNLDFTGQDLHLLTFIGDSFVGTDFAGANLAGSLFNCTNCANANFFSANLSGANLAGANLTGANFALANLTSANLTGANLQGANLVGANVSGAYLTGADTKAANTVGAIGTPAAGKL